MFAKIISICTSVVLSSNLMAGTPSFLCKTFSTGGCTGNSIGSTCGDEGKCYVTEWSSDEPECVCIEMKKSQCRWTSDSDCKEKFPGPQSSGGVCVVKSASFDEPECKFVPSPS